MFEKKLFSVESIEKETYMHSKHFVGGRGTTKEYPDPLPALATSFGRKLLSSKGKRKSPLKRHSQPKLSKRKKLLDEPVEDMYNSEIGESDNPFSNISVNTDHNFSQTNDTVITTEKPSSPPESFMGPPTIRD